MPPLDHVLIYKASKLATGENVHRITTYLFYYEKATNARMRARYEGMLREFVAVNNRIATRRAHLALLRARSKTLHDISDFLAQQITDLVA